VRITPAAAKTNKKNFLFMAFSLRGISFDGSTLLTTQDKIASFPALVRSCKLNVPHGCGTAWDSHPIPLTYHSVHHPAEFNSAGKHNL